MTIGERFRRWRATKGYGVHSPLAFRLLGNVVKPQRNVMYYGEERLIHEFDSDPDLRRARLLLRLVAELQPSYVWKAPGLPDIYDRAVGYGGGAVRIYDGKIFPVEIRNSDLVVLHGKTPKAADIKKMMVPGKTVIGFGLKPGAVSRILAALDGGPALDGVESFIAVNRAGEEAPVYQISKF